MLAPAGGAGDRERKLTVQQAICVEKRRQVLARLEGRDGQCVRTAEILTLAGRREGRVDAGVGDVNPVGRHTESRRDVVAGEARVDHHDVGARTRVAVFRPVHAARPCVNPFREMERDEVVNHRRAHTAPLRGIHPVAEVEDVEVSDDALCRRPAGTAPGRSQRVCRGNERQLSLDVHPVERCFDRAPAARTRGSERDDVVPTRLREPEQRAADVVADPGERVRQRRDVDDDPHGPGDGAYRNPLTSTPRRRESGLFNTG